MPSLFDPLTVGDLRLPNRIIMAPLTRCRCDEGRVPNAMMAEYYRQRSSAGMIISEATSVTPMGVGYPDTPGIWSPQQVAGWQRVTKAVHDAGGQILLQLWHVGRISDPVYLNGGLPVAPSAIQPSGHPSLIRPLKEFVTPRALERSELSGVIDAYRTGTKTRRPPVLMAWNCMARMAICSINFCRAVPTTAPTITAVQSKIAPGSCSKRLTPRSISGVRAGSAFTCLPGRTFTPWVMPTAPRLLDMSQKSLESERSLLSARANTPVKTDSGHS